MAETTSAKRRSDEAETPEAAGCSEPPAPPRWAMPRLQASDAFDFALPGLSEADRAVGYSEPPAPPRWAMPSSPASDAFVSALFGLSEADCWIMPRSQASDGFVSALLGLSEADLAQHESLVYASLDGGVHSDPSADSPGPEERAEHLRLTVKSALSFSALFGASVFALRRLRALNLHSAPAESAARVVSLVHALCTTCAAGVLAPALWSRLSASEFASSLFRRRNSRAERRLAALSNGYFVYDMLYLLVYEPDPLFLAHHAVCLTIWNGALARGRGADMVNKRLERSGPNLKPETVCVYGMNLLKKSLKTTQHSPSPAFRAEVDLPTNVQAVSRAVSYVNTHCPRFQVRVRPS